MIYDLNYDTFNLVFFPNCEIPGTPVFFLYLSSSSVMLLSITHIAMFIILDPRKNHMKLFV